MTNKDIINLYTDKQLALFIKYICDCYACPVKNMCDRIRREDRDLDDDDRRTCHSIILEWLNQEKDDTDYASKYGFNDIFPMINRDIRDIPDDEDD